VTFGLVAEAEVSPAGDELGGNYEVSGLGGLVEIALFLLELLGEVPEFLSVLLCLLLVDFDDGSGVVFFALDMHEAK